MQVVSRASELSLKQTVLCIGNFDGVHLGHQMLLNYMQTEAKAKGVAGVILTFFPPSKHFFSQSPFLSTQEEKLELFSAFDPAAVIVVPFTEAFTKTPKDVFLQDIAQLEPQTIIVGENFRFGHERKGNLYDLSKHTGRLEVFNLKHGEGEAISSTRIRELLLGGEIAEVNKLLGRDYSASGNVIEGDKRGRSIGYPTANLAIDRHKALPYGVFAVRVKTPLGMVDGMANVGPRPSFPNDPPALEVNLFDFDAPLYGETLTVYFVAALRKQQKFEGLEALKAQLARDKEKALELLRP
ncbi:MAG: riboflavin biosynthesis protein RibF [Trueperaceae bacterium]|nr:riboflavin biosynthesis protein RibF [Trueperaceae bacterium]